MVNIIDYAIRRALARRNRRLRTFAMEMASGASMDFKLSLFELYQDANKNVKTIHVRKTHKSSCNFNIAMYYDHMSLPEFRLFDIRKMSSVFHVPNGETRRRGYVCAEVT